MNVRKKKSLTVVLAILFAVYLLVLADLLFLVNRSGGYHGVNLRPFRSVSNYLSALRAGNINPSIVFRNLLGNVLLFMPLAFCLPILFPALRKWYVCLPLIAAVIILAEVSQYLFAVGSCDVDDFILNYPRGQKFLKSLFSRHFNYETIELIGFD